ncbi:hypothetical protein FQZ97_615830 [compost metagenome]
MHGHGVAVAEEMHHLQDRLAAAEIRARGHRQSIEGVDIDCRVLLHARVEHQVFLVHHTSFLAVDPQRKRIPQRDLQRPHGNPPALQVVPDILGAVDVDVTLRRRHRLLQRLLAPALALGVQRRLLHQAPRHIGRQALLVFVVIPALGQRLGDQQLEGRLAHHLLAVQVEHLGFTLHQGIAPDQPLQRIHRTPPAPLDWSSRRRGIARWGRGKIVGHRGQRRTHRRLQRQRRLQLLAHRIEAGGLVQVVPVLAIGADREHRHATDLQRRCFRLATPRVARLRRVVVAAEHQARGGVLLAHRPRHRRQVAGIHRHHHRPAGRLDATGRRGIALGQSDHLGVAELRQGMEAPALAAVLGKQLGAVAADMLQGVQHPAAVAQRDHQITTPHHQHRQVRRARLGQVLQVGLRIGASPDLATLFLVVDLQHHGAP